MNRTVRVKLVIEAILAVLVVVVVLQNLAPVSTQFLFVTVAMPKAVLLIVTLGIGFAAGLLAAGIKGKKR